jgi:streptopain
MRVLYDVADQKSLAYVFQLELKGYLVVSIDTQLRPVVAYSYSSDFPWEAVSQNLLLSMLRLDMAYRLEAVQRGVAKTATTTRNEGLWNSYLSESKPQVSPRETGEGTQQWGPWVATTWSQGNPYNMRCPIDPEMGERSITGYVATAMGQIIDYWDYPSSVNFEESDDYYTTTRHLFVNANPDADISSINYNEVGSHPSNQTIAELLFAAGVSVRMNP